MTRRELLERKLGHHSKHRRAIERAQRAMETKHFPMKPITDDTLVAWVDGKEISADHLQRWAYDQIASAPKLMERLEAIKARIEDGREAFESFGFCASDDVMQDVLDVTNSILYSVNGESKYREAKATE